MSAVQKLLASHILEEHFGSLVEKVGTCLVARGHQTLRDVVRDTGLATEEVQKALCSLIQHHLVNFEKSKRNTTVYNACLVNILLFTRFSRYTFSARERFGEEAELIVEHVLQQGSDSMSGTVGKISQRYESGDNAEHIRAKFAELVGGHFVKRLVLPLQETDDAEAMVKLEENLYTLPPGMAGQGFTQRKRKRSVDESQEQSTKRQRTSSSGSGTGANDLPDDGILWQVNFSRFHQHFLDKAIASAVAKRIDESASNIVETMLKVDELSREPLSPTSKPVTLFEISKNLNSEVKMENSQINHYLTLLVDDKVGFLNKTGDSGGGTYCVNLQKCLTALCQHSTESVVQERFGSRFCRIFRLLLMKKHLEQKQIGELSMIPSKDAKEMLYKLFAERFITLQEVPRASDYAPSRTIYLFSVNLRQLSRMLLERCYQTLANLKLRRKSETQKQGRLIEKRERLDATIAALRAQHGEEEAAEAIAELEELMTAADRKQLSRLKTTCAKLEQSEIQVDETVFILSQYVAS